MDNFLTSYIGYLENTDSLSYADLPNVIFNYKIFLKITLISLPISSEKPSTIEKLSGSW